MKLWLRLHVCSISCFIFVSSFLSKTFVSLSLPSRRPDQVEILLALKNEFTSCNVMPATNSWTKHTITFDGVVFDNETGVVTELHLHNQCLSGNFKANSSLFRFKHLRYLDLSNNLLFGGVPSSVGNLSRLTYLDLSQNNLTGSFPFIYNITKLSDINLSLNHFSGTIPSSLFSMSFLSSLNLSQNRLRDPLEIMNISSSFQLKKLSLGTNLFSNRILEPISKLVSLTYLDLSFNDFVSTPFPTEFGKLADLKVLYLQDNGFIDEVPSSVCNLSHLTDLDLSSNNLFGPIPSCLLTTSSSLSNLDLSGNNLHDPLEYINSSSSSSKLQRLILGHNLISSKILEPISKLVNLTDLDISFLNITHPNNFSFLPFKSLKTLDISGNSIPWISSIPDDALSTKFTILGLSSCNISEFPKFLKKQRNLEGLDISNNQIKGKVPEWLWNLPSLDIVWLSHNSFNGFEGSQEALLSSSVWTLQLDSNLFQGSFPILPSSLEYLSAANNNFTGDIPLSLCDLTLSAINLSNNNFSGSIPQCFRERLEVFNVGNNSLSGSLSVSFNRPYPFLTTLDVGHNQITGKLPRSLVNCTKLEILNVESNRITDNFPFELKTLPNLQVLVLRSNRFHGPISSLQGPLSFPQLRIIDISRNNFTGSLPKNYFVNWSTPLVSMPEVYRLPEYMQSRFWRFYQPSIYVTNKGQSMELEKIPMTYTAIDFSGNKFEGQIPESIGLLKYLVVFNLSNNVFTGHIPFSLAKLTMLESLDLSGNQLSEKIPQELASLGFLAYINVSHNKLTGQIPQSTQFGGQPKSSFEGNIDLCGLPLQKSCFEDNVPQTPPIQQSKSLEEEHLLNWKAAAISYGPGVLLGVAIAQALATYKPVLFYKLFRL